MTNQEIEKLKALCEKEGFDIKESHEGQTFFIKKKDEWDGVEFAECIDDHLLRGSIEKGKIYKTRTTDLVHCVGIEGKWGGFGKEHFKPSTEAAYVEQLKAKAKELYGEIKGGDKFDRSSFKEKTKNPVAVVFGHENFTYDKDDDTLWYGGAIIYRVGVWAKKIEEPIRVIVTSLKLDYPTSVITFDVTANRKRVADTEELANHIEESIESFLNRKR